MFFELPYKVYLYTGKSDMMIPEIDVMEKYSLFIERKHLEGHKFILADKAEGLNFAILNTRSIK